jgi:hypothetical protein
MGIDEIENVSTHGLTVLIKDTEFSSTNPLKDGVKIKGPIHARLGKELKIECENSSNI